MTRTVRLLAQADDRINAWFARLWVRRLGRCSHLSHRQQLRCWRAWRYQSKCWRHNFTCYITCEAAKR